MGKEICHINNFLFKKKSNSTLTKEMLQLQPASQVRISH